MVDPCGPNVVDGPLSWLCTRPVIFGQGFLATFASQSLEQSKSLLQISYPAFNGLTKAKRQSVFHRNLGGDVGRHRFPSPRTLAKMAPVPKGTGAVKTILMERATGIEPASSAWKAGVLPLNYARKIWSGRQDLNLRHPAPKAGALPNCATSRRC